MDRIALFRDYLTKKPTDRFALYSLALELAKAERFEQAEAAFRNLLTEHPQSGAGHFQLGSLFAAQERFEDAIGAWRAGLAALAGAVDEEARRSRVEIEAAIEDALDELS